MKNLDYFKNWSSNMSYILGFITGDGHVDNYRLRIQKEKILSI